MKLSVQDTRLLDVSERKEGHEESSNNHRISPANPSVRRRHLTQEEKSNERHQGRSLMKVSVRDTETLKSLRPLELVQYLRVNGWQQSQQIPDKAYYWLGKGITGEELEILLPLRPDFADYTARMAEVLHVLEVAEGRSQLEILHDLSTSNADVVRIRTHMDEPELNGIQLDEGVLLHKRARDLWIAAACATHHPKPAFANRKPDPVLDSVRKVRFGMSESSSYVLTIIVPVPPALNVGDRVPSEASEPFERKTALTLAEALRAVR
jgi:hypothetical protein